MSFTSELIAWQKQAGRHDLPWQNTRDAYRIWLSEIMLQQTQVKTVIDYYLRFLTRFPDVHSLAAAPQDEVLTYWAGLGYYARARNLHRCAQQVSQQHQGQFPADPQKLAELPGIGRSTAAAIAAFAYGRRAAILDGNVKRVLCRYFALSGLPQEKAVERELWALAESLLPEQEIEAYTQGLMDLGATVCTRQQARCPLCPVAAGCQARAQGRQHLLPTPKIKAAVPQRKACYLLIFDGHNLLLQRRPASGIWGGLLVPPEGEIQPTLDQLGLTLESAVHLPPLKHTFTHFRLQLEPVLCRVQTKPFALDGGLHWLPLHKAADAGVPTPIKKLIRLVASELDSAPKSHKTPHE